MLHDPKLGVAADTKFPVAQDFCAQPGVFPEKFFCAGGKGDIHPFARRAMLRAAELHALNFEIATDEGKQIDAGDDNIAAQYARRFLPDSKVRAKPLENLRGKKRDLAFVIFPVIKVTIADQTLACDTFDSLLLD